MCFFVCPVFSVCLFVVAFIYMADNQVTPQFLVAVSSSLTVAGYIINTLLNNTDAMQGADRTSKWGGGDVHVYVERVSVVG
jgi:hypothetical protein